jgi:hypothetical protein
VGSLGVTRFRLPVSREDHSPLEGESNGGAVWWGVPLSSPSGGGRLAAGQLGGGYAAIRVRLDPPPLIRFAHSGLPPEGGEQEKNNSPLEGESSGSAAWWGASDREQKT